MDTLDNRTVGKLDLRQSQHLGDGHHSYVYLAPLTLPLHAGPTRQVEVAVKVRKSDFFSQRMLTNEAEIYAKFPCELQESTPSSPPVVPKFFGYYEPSHDLLDRYRPENGDEENASTVPTLRFVLNNISPILLLEPCGRAVKDGELSKSAK